MQRADVQMLSSAISDMGAALLRRKMQEREKEQQDRENQLKQAMLDLQTRTQDSHEKSDRAKLIEENLRGLSEDTERNARAVEAAGRGRYYDALASGEISNRSQKAPPKFADLSPAEKLDLVNKQITQAGADFQAAQKQPGVTSEDLLPHQMKLSLLSQTRDAIMNPPKKPLLADVNVVDDDGTPSGRARIPTDQLATMGLKLAGGGMGGPPAAAVGAPGALTQEQVLQAVRSGKMSRDQAKAYAQQQGW